MNLQLMKVILSLVLLIAFTTTSNADAELRMMKNENVLQYKIISSDSKLVTMINETALTTNWWHSLDSGTGAYSFSDLARTLQGPHIHLVEDEPLLIKGISSAKPTEVIKVKEIIVGLFRRADNRMSANRFFAITTEAKIVVLQKVSGHKIITDLTPLINKM